MKILFLVTRQFAEKTDGPLIQGIQTLKAAGTDCRFLLPNEENGFCAYLPKQNTDFLTVPNSLLPELRKATLIQRLKDLIEYYRCLSRYFDMYGFDQVHTVGVLAHFFGGLLKTTRNFELFWAVTEIPPRGLKFLLFKLFLDLFCDRYWSLDSTVIAELGRSLSWRKKYFAVSVESSSQDLVRLHEAA